MIENKNGRARYSDRLHAGSELAVELRSSISDQDPIVLAIPRGGVPVAASIANDFRCELDLVIPRRIEAPNRPDVTLGAVTADRTLVLNRGLVSELGLSDEQVEELSIPVWAEVERTQQAYRRGRPYPDLRGRVAVIVDDRLLSGYTMIAAVMSVRKLEPSRIVVAVPVAYLEGIERVRGYVDELVSLEISTTAAHIGARFYANLTPVTDKEVIWTLDRFWAERPPTGYSETF